jgi:glycosyltransferase involved in cell wall biosynthesis
MSRVHWRALSTAKADGYAYASWNLSSRLKDRGLIGFEDNSFSNVSVSSISISPLEGIKFIEEPSDLDVLINNCLPVDYSFEADYVVGFSYWETSVLPSNWVSLMNQCDEVWTTSRWAKSAFENSGVTRPVYAFNLGVDTDVFYYRDRSHLPYRPFTFVHVGSPSTRKNTQLVVDAFIRLFGDDENYRLIIKSNGPPDARYIKDGINLGSLYHKNNIKIIDSYLTDEQLADLFASCNCMVYPTRGEGWGMAPFQAIATGLPTICTNRTACEEFAGLSVPLEAPMTAENQFGIYQTGEWANPHIDVLCDRMLYVVNNYNDVIETTRSGADRIKLFYSWDVVVDDFASRIHSLVNND